MKLHLGCGRYYLDGYTNIDYPAAEHTVQTGIKADMYCDVVTLEFDRASIEEIRLHHVFEHFPRPTALALICRWRDWLKVGGILRLETPDLTGSVWLLASPFLSYRKKQQVIRHLFGSHEARWAVHWDGWYARRFRRTLLSLGFEKPAFNFTKWGVLRNVDVTVRKTAPLLGFQQYAAAVKELLQECLITDAKEPNQITGSENELLNVWMQNWENVYTAK